MIKHNHIRVVTAGAATVQVAGPNRFRIGIIVSDASGNQTHAVCRIDVDHNMGITDHSPCNTHEDHRVLCATPGNHD